MRTAALSMIALAVFLSPYTARAGSEIEQIVVLPFSVSGGIDEKKGELLDELFLTELSQYVPGKVKLVGSSDVSAMLGQVQQKQLTGCDDTACLVEIGHALGASHLIVSSLGVLGDRFVVNSKLISVNTAEVGFRKALYLGETEGELLGAIQTLTKALASSQGWLSAESAPGVAAAAAPSGDPERDPAVPEGEADPGVDLLLISGIGVAGGGALAAVGFGVGALIFDAQSGDPRADWADRQSAGQLALGMLGGSALGVLLLGGGAALAAMSLMGSE